MKPYIVLKVGEKDYRLRISTASAIELEDKLNCSVVDGMNRLAEIRVLAKFVYAAAKDLNDGIKTESDAHELIDEYTMQGNTLDDLREVFLDVMVASGHLEQEAVDESKKMSAQLKEKIRRKQAESLSK